MGFFDQVKETITSTSQDVANKTKEISETMKVNNKVHFVINVELRYSRMMGN